MSSLEVTRKRRLAARRMVKFTCGNGLEEWVENRGSQVLWPRDRSIALSLTAFWRLAHTHGFVDSRADIHCIKYYDYASTSYYGNLTPQGFHYRIDVDDAGRSYAVRW